MVQKPPDFSLLGREVREARERMEWTQLDVADEAGVSQRFVSKIEAGECKRPSLKLLSVLAALDLPQEQVFRPGPDEPVVTIIDDEWRSEAKYQFDATNRPAAIELMTENRVVTALPESAYDFNLVLRGPAHVAVVEQDDGSYQITVQFDGTPDGLIVVEGYA